jgi:hypothetical protein
MDDPMLDSRTFHTLALVASLRAAVSAARAVAERRAGRDPSDEQPAAEARAGLAAAVGRLQAGLVRLRVRLAVGAPAEAPAALVQAFEDRLLAADLARDLHRAHQHLLSLFPAVEAGVVEAVRLAHAAADRLAETDDFEPAAAPFAADLRALLDALN